ncbi:MAG: hypothetical protein MJK12_08600 [Colwellia sp.]|nr:hypothetical protein [Colwellia sp.]
MNSGNVKVVVAMKINVMKINAIKVKLFYTWRSLFFISLTVIAFTSIGEEFTEEHKQWLKQKFAEQHQNLIPIVAVADMYFACNKLRKVDPIQLPLADLVTKEDKNVLAEKLSVCLGSDEIKSDLALNFGLQGCFHQQLSGLPDEERKIKMELVDKAILSLSREERQQSFTRCVNAQTIVYLK